MTKTWYREKVLSLGGCIVSIVCVEIVRLFGQFFAEVTRPGNKVDNILRQ